MPQGAGTRPHRPASTEACRNDAGYVVGLRAEGLASLENATKLDPSSSLAWFRLVHAYNRMGKPSIAHFERALRLDPRDFRHPSGKPAWRWLTVLRPLRQGGQLADEALLQLPGFSASMLGPHGGAEPQAGEIEAINRTVEAFLAASPGSTIASVIDRLMPADYHSALSEGYRLAGLPNEGAAPARRHRRLMSPTTPSDEERRER